jgi:hypothetical protein
MRAEIYRELGVFERSIEISRAISGKHQWVATQIMAVDGPGDAQVAVLKPPIDDD